MAKNNHQTGGNRGSDASEKSPGPGAGAAAASLDVDDAELTRNTEGENAPDLGDSAGAVRQGEEGRPYCPTHNCLCKATSSSKTATYYACPVPGCETRTKRARPQTKMPADAMACTSRSCQEASGGKEGAGKRYLVVNDKLSTVANLHMECGGCGFHVKVPRPQFTPNLARQRELAATDDFAER